MAKTMVPPGLRPPVYDYEKDISQTKPAIEDGVVVGPVYQKGYGGRTEVKDPVFEPSIGAVNADVVMLAARVTELEGCLDELLSTRKRLSENLRKYRESRNGQEKG